MKNLRRLFAHRRFGSSLESAEKRALIPLVEDDGPSASWKLKNVRDADCCKLSEIIEDEKFYESLLSQETFDGIQIPRHFTVQKN